MIIYLLLYIVCDSSSGYVFACVLYVICLLYSHLTSVIVDVSDNDSGVGLSAVVADAGSDAEVTKSSLHLNKIVLLEQLGCSCQFV